MVLEKRCVLVLLVLILSSALLRNTSAAPPNLIKRGNWSKAPAAADKGGLSPVKGRIKPSGTTSAGKKTEAGAPKADTSAAEKTQAAPAQPETPATAPSKPAAPSPRQTKGAALPAAPKPAQPAGPGAQKAQAPQGAPAAPAPGAGAAPAAAGTEKTAEKPSSPPKGRIEPGEGKKAGTISKGVIPLKEFLGFIAAYKGVPVLYDSALLKTDPQLLMAADLTNVTYEVVKAILEINGYTVTERKLPDDTYVIEVGGGTAIGRPTTAGRGREVHPTPIVELDTVGEAAVELRRDQVATIVVPLKHAEIEDVRQVLQGVLGGPTTGKVTSTSGGYAMIEVKRTNTLILKAKYGLLEYIKEIIRRVDVPLPEEEQIIEILDVREADVANLVRVIEEVLRGVAEERAGPGTRTSSSTIRRTTSSSFSRSSSFLRSRYGGYGSAYGAETLLVPDERTQRIVVVTTSEYELELVRTLVEELDTEVTNVRRRTHIYQVKYLTAADVAAVLVELIEGTGRMGGLRGRTSGVRRSTTRSPLSRTSTTGTTPTTSTSRMTGPRSYGGEIARIVPHEQTNSLLIQADPDVYDEIIYILNGIDRKRNQVFLEAALVQVAEESDLNYTIELLAGNLDDRALRAAAMTAFGLSALDATGLPDTFDRVFLETAPASGLLGAVSHKGRIPALIRFFKNDNESQIVATPFILADDNERNEINITRTTYILTTEVLNVNASTTRPTGEDAGVRLAITPTISRNAVLLDLELEVSQFAEAATIQGNLPDKNTNLVQGKVTVPDGELLVVGGLTTQTYGRVVDKIPLLGDLPIIGWLFQSKSVNKKRSNLYAFLSAYVLSDRYFRDVEHITGQARRGVESFKDAKNIRIQNFTAPPRFEETKENLDTGKELRPVSPTYERIR